MQKVIYNHLCSCTVIGLKTFPAHLSAMFSCSFEMLSLRWYSPLDVFSNVDLKKYISILKYNIFTRYFWRWNNSPNLQDAQHWSYVLNILLCLDSNKTQITQTLSAIILPTHPLTNGYWCVCCTRGVGLCVQVAWGRCDIDKRCNLQGAWEPLC